jgi:hypothetical protein
MNGLTARAWVILLGLGLAACSRSRPPSPGSGALTPFTPPARAIRVAGDSMSIEGLWRPSRSREHRPRAQ